MTTNTDSTVSTTVQELFDTGAHIGYRKGRRHPSTIPFIYGTKSSIDLIDLTQTEKQLEEAIAFLLSISKKGKKILFVGTKPESSNIVREKGAGLDMPYVDRRWIGGTFTNFPEIRKRAQLLEDLTKKQIEGKLTYKTKKEKLTLERKIEKLGLSFAGLRVMDTLPGAIVIIDSKHDDIAVQEAQKMHIPVVSISNTDCNVALVDFPIMANDSSHSTINYIISKIAEALLA